MKVNVYDQEGQSIELDNPTAETLMLAIRDAGLSITAHCGGTASCATCHVYVDHAWSGKLDAPNPTEAGMLDFAEERRENSRLSCQIFLSAELDGLTVTLAPGTKF